MCQNLTCLYLYMSSILSLTHSQYKKLLKTQQYSFAQKFLYNFIINKKTCFDTEFVTVFTFLFKQIVSTFSCRLFSIILVWLSIYLSDCPYIFLIVHIFVWLYIHLSDCTYICLIVHILVWLSIYVLVWLSIYLSVTILISYCFIPLWKVFPFLKR